MFAYLQLLTSQLAFIASMSYSVRFDRSSPKSLVLIKFLLNIIKNVEIGSILYTAYALRRYRVTLYIRLMGRFLKRFADYRSVH